MVNTFPSRKQKQLIVVIVVIVVLTIVLVVQGRLIRQTSQSPQDIIQAGNTLYQPIGQTGNWQMIFDDEFDNAALNTTTWHTDFWWAAQCSKGASGYELQAYTPANVAEYNGNLVLTAQKQDYTCPEDKRTYAYTSGMAMSGGQSHVLPPGFSFTYGYVEARVKVPNGNGLWPTFLMLPAQYKDRPEVDIMEMYDKNTTHYSQQVHLIDGKGVIYDKGNDYIGPDLSADFHILGFQWDQNSLVWYIDGQPVWTYTGPAIPHEAMYLLFNLALGNPSNKPDATTSLPSQMLIDYVRVWQPSSVTVTSTPSSFISPSTIPTINAPQATVPIVKPTIPFVHDMQPPSVTITSPTMGATVQGITTIQVSAHDVSGTVSKMELLINNHIVTVANDTDSLSYVWNTEQYPKGTYVLLGKAYDRSQNMSESSIKVHVP